MTNLESRYNNLFGPKTSKGQLYGGFFLLIAGVVLGIAALILFFIGYNAEAESTQYYRWREGALTIGALALTMIPLGISVSLPTKTGMRILSYIGVGLCLLATVLFFIHYPENFNVKGSGQKDYTGLDTAIYAIGFTFLVASLFTSIIGYYLGKLQPVAAEGGEDVDDESYGPGYEVPDWVVERDIEYAMKKHGVSWGDGRSGSGSSPLGMTLGESNFVVGGLGKARTVQLDAEQVDTGVAQLTQIKPTKKPTIPGQWEDESTAALRKLRANQQSDPKQFTPKSVQLGFWRRLWNSLTGRGHLNRGAAAVVSGSAGGAKANLNPVAPPVNLPKKGKTIVIEDEK